MIINKYQYRKQHVLHYRQSREKKRQSRYCIVYIDMYIYTVHIPSTTCLYVRRDQSHFVTIYTYILFSHTYIYTYIYVSERRNEDEEGACPRKAAIMTTDHYLIHCEAA